MGSGSSLMKMTSNNLCLKHGSASWIIVSHPQITISSLSIVSNKIPYVQNKKKKIKSHTALNIFHLLTYILSFIHSCGAKVIWETKTDLEGFGVFERYVALTKLQYLWLELQNKSSCEPVGYVQINLQDILDSPTPLSFCCAKSPGKSLILMEHMDCNNVKMLILFFLCKRVTVLFFDGFNLYFLWIIWETG